MLTGFPWGQTGNAVTSALLSFFMNPLLYIGIALIVWDLSRNGKHEKKLFGVRVTKSRGFVVALWLQSVALGLLMTIVCAVAGVVVTAQEVWLVTGLSIVFGVIRIRLISPVYSMAACIAVGVVLRWLPSPAWGPSLNTWWHVLSGFHVVSWLALLALTFLMEGLALRWNRNTPGFPAAALSRRGRSIGGFLMKLAFIAPVLLVSPGHDIGVTAFPHAWPWLTGPQPGLALIGLPILMGHSGLFTTVTPRDGLRRIWPSYVYTGLLAGVCVYVAHQFGTVYSAVGAVLAIAVKEWTLWRSRRAENRLDPLFTPTPEGVRVLTTIHDSLSHALGLRPGEVITHVNQVPVHTPYDLHFAFDQNPAYAKLQVLDTRGETRFVGNPVYSGERNQLGLILAPDGYGPCFHQVQPGLFQTASLRLTGSGRSPEMDWAETVPLPPSD